MLHRSTGRTKRDSRAELDFGFDCRRCSAQTWDVNSGPAGLWSFGGSLVQPIFAGGRIRSGVRLSEARQQEALLTHRQTIQQAFRGVSDGLVEYHKDREFREYQQHLALSAQDAAQLSEMRYRGGVASYLEVLTNETNLLLSWDSLRLS